MPLKAQALPILHRGRFPAGLGAAKRGPAAGVEAAVGVRQNGNSAHPSGASSRARNRPPAGVALRNALFALDLPQCGKAAPSHSVFGGPARQQVAMPQAKGEERPIPNSDFPGWASTLRQRGKTMKHLLIAASILAMTAGVASADITFSGSASAGIAKNGTANSGTPDPNTAGSPYSDRRRVPRLFGLRSGRFGFGRHQLGPDLRRHGRHPQRRRLHAGP